MKCTDLFVVVVISVYYAKQTVSNKQQSKVDIKGYNSTHVKPQQD